MGFWISTRIVGIADCCLIFLEENPQPSGHLRDRDAGSTCRLRLRRQSLGTWWVVMSRAAVVLLL